MSGHPQQPILNPYQGQAAPYYYQSSREYRPTGAYRFRKLLFLALGIMVVLNLNILSNRILEIDQLASPFILLTCILGVAYSKVSRVNGVPLAARLFLVALMFVLGVGIMVGLTRGLHKIGLVGSTTLKDLATIIVFYAAVLLSRSMQKLGGEFAEKQVLNICYWLSFLATAAVFLPYIFPAWHDLIRGDINESRLSGVYGNPNTTSMATLSFMIFGLAKTAHDKKMIHLIIAMAIGAAAILATGSRSGILGIFLIVAPLGAILFGFKHVFRLVLTFIIMGALGIAVYQGIVQKAKGSNSRRWEQTLSLYQDGLTDENTSGRFTLGKVAIEMFQDKPLVGWGVGGSRPMLPYSNYGPHNYYFVVLVETGLLGFVPFMFFWVFVGIKAFDPRIENWSRVLTLGLFLVISTSGLASHTIFTERNQVFLLGAALGLTRNR